MRVEQDSKLALPATCALQVLIARSNWYVHICACSHAVRLARCSRQSKSNHEGDFGVPARQVKEIKLQQEPWAVAVGPHDGLLYVSMALMCDMTARALAMLKHSHMLSTHHKCTPHPPPPLATSFPPPRLTPPLSHHRHRILVIDPNSGGVLRAFHARGKASRHEPPPPRHQPPIDQGGDPLGNEAEERRVDIAGAKKKNFSTSVSARMDCQKGGRYQNIRNSARNMHQSGDG